MVSEHTLVEWEERPYTSHDKRHIIRFHRVRVLVSSRGDTDVVHEARESNSDNGWEMVRALEVRDHGVNTVRAGVGGA